MPEPAPPKPPGGVIDDATEFCAVVDDDGNIKKTQDEWNKLDMDGQVEE